MMDYTLEDSVYVLFTTRAFATGIPGTLSASTVAVYEDVTATPILTSVAVTEDLNSIVGLNAATIAATAANGFNADGTYHVVIEAGTVDSVSVVGEVVASFTVARSAAAVDLANGTDGLGAIKAETALIVADTGELQTDDVPTLIATAQSDLDKLTGTDGATLATAQGNYAPSKAGDSMALTAGGVDDIWDEDVDASHQTAGTAGKKLDDAGAGGDPWATALPGAYGAGTAGKIVGDNIDSPLSAIKAETALIVADTNELQTDDVPTLIGAVQSDTDDIQTRLPAALVGGAMDSDVSALQANVITAASIAASAFDSKGNWNIGKTGYSLSQAFPTNFAAIGITAGGRVDGDVLAINGSTLAAIQLALSAEQIEDGALEGTPSVSTLQTDLAETQDDIYIGRIIIMTSGAARGEATDIIDYTGATGTLEVTDLANQPSAADTFILI